MNEVIVKTENSLDDVLLKSGTIIVTSDGDSFMLVRASVAKMLLVSICDGNRWDDVGVEPLNKLHSDGVSRNKVIEILSEGGMEVVRIIPKAKITIEEIEE